MAASEADRSPSLPDIPTLREAGFPDVVTTSWFGFSAAADIPPEIARRWETEIAAAVQSAQVKEAFAREPSGRHSQCCGLHPILIRSELTTRRE